MNIIISIKPQYASLIVEKEKLVEFRKSFSNKEINKCYIYSSSPEKRIIGYFIIKHLDIDSPVELWRKYKLIGGINEDDFFQYYKNKDLGTCLVIDSVVSFDVPLNPKISIPGFIPPQSYCYLDRELEI